MADRFVIIRALLDEPVRLRFVGVHGRAVEAVGPNGGTPMPFHLTRAYRFDAGLFRKLRAAFESGNREALVNLWDNASAFTPDRPPKKPPRRG